jgi:hypothetical protein
MAPHALQLVPAPPSPMLSAQLKPMLQLPSAPPPATAAQQA